MTAVALPARLLPALLLALALSPPAWAAEVIDVQTFADPADMVRYRALTDELRCPKCLNTNLSGSDSPIASDLRHVVAERIRAGDSDAEIRAWLQARYGDFILYRPPFNARTALLWLGPFVLCAVGFLVVWRVVRRRAGSAEPALSDAERQQLSQMLAAAGEATAGQPVPGGQRQDSATASARAR